MSKATGVSTVEKVKATEQAPGALLGVMLKPILWLQPLLDKRLTESERPFAVAKPVQFPPYHNSRLWGWTHYGIFIPDLPVPYRYLNIMTLVGATGTLCFDNDYLAARDARNTATVLCSTAHANLHHYKAYDITTDCKFSEDGSHLEWGDNLEITSSYPNFTVKGQFENFSMQFEVVATDQVSWFTKSAIYDHFSLFANYRGTIIDATGVTTVSGLCTVEYAQAISPQSLSSRPLSGSWKLPVVFFTYQIINLNAQTQLLLTNVRLAGGATLARLAFLRSTITGRATVYEDVTFEVLEYQHDKLVDPLGRKMRVPSQMRWRVAQNGTQILQLTANVDSQLRYGHGRGYVGAYSYTGTWNEGPIRGSGYLEWIDLEHGPAVAARL